jgi:RNA recognition motif-containing protein
LPPRQPKPSTPPPGAPPPPHPTPPPPPPAGTTVYVYNLAWTTETDALTEHAKSAGAGAIKAVTIKMTRMGRSRGIGFLEFDSPEAAQRAVEVRFRMMSGGRWSGGGWQW